VERRKTGEDAQAYTRILKFRNKKFGLSIRDIIIFVFTVIFAISIAVYLGSNASGEYGSMIFLIFAIFLIITILAFIDYSTGIGLFKERGVLYSSVIILVSVIISIFVTSFSSTIFNADKSTDTLALVSLIGLLFINAISTMFILKATPTREGREQMIARLKEVREEISESPLSLLGSKEAATEAQKWLLRQYKSGIWGVEQPMYETSEVLSVFLEMGNDLNYIWKSIESGREVVHKLEQTYYLLLESIENIQLEPTHEILKSLLTIGMIDRDYIHPDIEDKMAHDSKIELKAQLKVILNEYNERLAFQTEWDFVSNLEKIDKHELSFEEIPPIFTFVRLFHLFEDEETTQKITDLITNTFGILINRSDKRFTQMDERIISDVILAKMYHSLRIIVMKPQSLAILPTETMFDEVIEEKEEEDLLLPNLDNLMSDDDFGLPSTDFLDALSDDGAPGSTVKPEKSNIRLNASLSSIRKFIRERQLIDGSWASRIDTTAECLRVIIHNEAIEEIQVKSAVNYLLALQLADGSWQEDILLTTRVLKSLNEVNKKLLFGAFQ
jgi:hypothetical protein